MNWWQKWKDGALSTIKTASLPKLCGKAALFMAVYQIILLMLVMLAVVILYQFFPQLLVETPPKYSNTLEMLVWMIIIAPPSENLLCLFLPALFFSWIFRKDKTALTVILVICYSFFVMLHWYFNIQNGNVLAGSFSSIAIMIGPALVLYYSFFHIFLLRGAKAAYLVSVVIHATANAVIVVMVSIPTLLEQIGVLK